MTRSAVLFALGLFFLAHPVIAAEELLRNGSLDEKDGDRPAHWTIATDQKTSYREAAVLSSDMVLEISRDHTTRTMWQPISGMSPEKLAFCFDATPLRYRVYIKYDGGEVVQDVYPKTRNAIKMPAGKALKEFTFRIETDGRPCTVTINNLSLKADDNPYALDLIPVGSVPKTEGELRRYEPRRFMTNPKAKYKVLVMFYRGQPIADLMADDFARQFGWEADAVTGKKTQDPEKVQAAFDRGEYVLLVQGSAVATLRNADSPIARYIARGGKAVFFGAHRGSQFAGGALWVNQKARTQNDAMFQELAMWDVTPEGLFHFGIDVISEKAYGEGRVAEVAFKNANGFRHGFWPGVDEKELTPMTHDVQEKLGLAWMDYYPAIYAKLLMRLKGDYVPIPYEAPDTAKLTAGRHLLTRTVKDADGKDIGWRTDAVDVRFDDLPVVTNVTVAARRFRVKDGVAYELATDRPPVDGVRLEYAVTDGAKRLVARGEASLSGRIAFVPGMLQLPAVTLNFRTVNKASGHASKWTRLQCYVADEEPDEARAKYLTAGYLWVPLQYRTMFRDVFREIGINTENCWIPASYGAMADGFRWTDGWGGPIENEGFIRLAMQEQGIYAKGFGDDPVKKHWRNGCMSDPKWKAALTEMLGKYIDLSKDNPPYMYSICDEMTLASPWLNYHAKDAEPCRMTHCLAAFRVRMREKYGEIAALNAKWGAKFASFDEVMPAVTTDVRGNGGKYASWVEFRSFMDDVMANASTVVAGEFAARGKGLTAAGQPNWCYRTPVTGVDPAKVVPARSGGQDYGPEKVVGSFKRPKSPILSWVGYFDYSNIGNVVWESLVNGGTGLMMYATFQTCNEWQEGYLTEYGRLNDNGKKLKKVLDPLVKGVGDLLNAAKPLPPEAVVLDVQAGMYVAWLEDGLKEFFDWGDRGKDRFGPYLNWFRAREQWERILHTLRTPFVYASENDLQAKLRTAKVLVLPECYALSAKTRETVKAFEAVGGLVVYDYATGLFDETGDRTGDAFRASLKGLDLGSSELDVNDETLQAKVRAAFADAGCRAAYEIVRTADGKPANGLMVDARELADSMTLVVVGRAQDDGLRVKHGRKRFKEMETDLVLKLENPRYVCDLLSGRSLGKVSEVRWPASDGYRAFHLASVDFAAPKVELKGAMKPGATLRLSVKGRIETVYSLRVYDCNGDEQWAYRRNSPVTRDWKTPIGIPYNAQNLPWRVKVE